MIPGPVPSPYNAATGGVRELRDGKPVQRNIGEHERLCSSCRRSAGISPIPRDWQCVHCGGRNHQPA